MKPIQATVTDDPRGPYGKFVLPAAIATGLLMFASVVGATTLNTSDSDSTSLDAVAATTTTAPLSLAPGDPGTTVAPTDTTAAPGGPAGTTATTAKASGTGTPATTPAPSGDLGPAQDPGPTSPTKPGKYDYKRSAGEQSQTGTTEVKDAGGGKQTHAMQSENNSSTNEYAWSATALMLTKTTFKFQSPQGSATGECDWQPDIQEYAFPLAVGAKWTMDSRCTAMVQNQTVTLHRQGTAEVTGLARIKVAGQVVDTWVIKRVENSNTNFGQGSIKADTTATEWFSPKHGLRVKSDGTAKTNTKFGDQERNNETKVSEEILNLDPK